MTIKRTIAVFYIIAALGLFLGAAGIIYTASAATEQEATEPMPVKPRVPLSILTQQGKYDFKVEVVSGWEEMRRGLMFREDVPEKTGMLFDFGNAQRISMWMKNTIVPLDMLFINKDGTIVDIAEKTTPFSLTVITSHLPAMAVLEVKAGTCNHYGITKGDRVKHPLFDPAS